MTIWGDCFLAATAFIDNLRSAVLNCKTPFKVLYNKKPTYDDLRTSGCLCYALVPATLVVLLKSKLYSELSHTRICEVPVFDIQDHQNMLQFLNV